MVESTALEMRHTRKGIVGSNPTLSAIRVIFNFQHIGNIGHLDMSDNCVTNGLSIVCNVTSPS